MRKTAGWIDLHHVIASDESTKLRQHAARFREAIAREEERGTERTKDPCWTVAKHKMLKWADALDREAGAAAKDGMPALLH